MGVANLTDAAYRSKGLAGGVALLAETPPAAATLAIYGATSIFGQVIAGGAQIVQAVTGSDAAKPVEQAGNIIAGPAAGLTTLVRTGGNAGQAEANANVENLYNGGVGLFSKATPALTRTAEFALSAIGMGSVGCSPD